MALFSTDSPFVYGPLGNCVILYTFFHCSPCISFLNNKRSRCTNNLCLQTLEPAKVLESAMRVMDGQILYRTINGERSYLGSESFSRRRSICVSACDKSHLLQFAPPAGTVRRAVWPESENPALDAAGGNRSGCPRCTRGDVWQNLVGG